MIYIILYVILYDISYMIYILYEKSYIYIYIYIYIQLYNYMKKSYCNTFFIFYFSITISNADCVTFAENYNNNMENII